MPSIKILDSIATLAPEAWSQLDCAGGLTGYAWLAMAERCVRDGLAARYFVLEENGVPIAAAVARLAAPGTVLSNPDRLLFGRLGRTSARAGATVLPALVCGVFDGTAPPVVFANGLDEHGRMHACRVLVDALEADADRARMPLIFAEVPSNSTDLCGELTRRGYPRMTCMPECVLEVAGPNVTAHLQASGDTGRRIAKFMRRERNQLTKAGVQIRRADPLAADTAALVTWFGENYRKHATGVFPFDAAFIRLLHEHSPEEVVVFVAEREGRLLGGSVLVHRAGIAHNRYVGIDAAREGSSGVYFGLVFHAPLEQVASLNLREIHYGRGLYDLKMRRGCTLVDTYLFLRPQSAVGRWIAGAWCRFATARYARKRTGPRRAVTS